MTLKDPLVLLVLDGESGQALKAVRCLAELDNVIIHVVSRDASAHIRLSRHIKSFTFLDTLLSHEQYTEQLFELVREKDVSMIFPILEKSVGMIGLLRERFEEQCIVPLIPDPDSFRIATDKRLLGAFMHEHGIPAPLTYVFDGVPGNEETIEALQYPVLAKPGRGGFGRNISTFSSADDLKSFLSDSTIEPSDYAVQSFMAGSDIDCSVICKHGAIVAHTIQQTIISSRRKYGPPTGIEFLQDDEVFEIVRQLMVLLNWNGVAHVDLRRDTAGRYYVLEINARYWGSLMGSMSAGVNFPGIACQLALGEEVQTAPVKHARYGVGLLTFKERRAQARAGIPLKNTQFRYMIKDPVPDVVETATILRQSLRARLTGK